MTNNVTLVLDGKSMYYTVLPDLRKDFIDLCTSCKAVVCCRVSPIQKAEMVELVTFLLFLRLMCSKCFCSTHTYIYIFFKLNFQKRFCFPVAYWTVW